MCQIHGIEQDINFYIYNLEKDMDKESYIKWLNYSKQKLQEKDGILAIKFTSVAIKRLSNCFSCVGVFNYLRDDNINLPKDVITEIENNIINYYQNRGQEYGEFLKKRTDSVKVRAI